ncbi:MAG TPA: sulfite exporter TauE/SafE family protein [Gaiellaceae bacterium]|jgi:hypothetical protein|nr:sulfite exporter TauE/SafE family protein [Gaiellaceae bacterium]
MAELIAGGVAVVVASFIGGVTGFGYGLVAAPALLLIGFSLPFVVTANLAIGLLTRLSVAVRLRRQITWRRSTILVVASIPGFFLGARLLVEADPTLIKVGLGALVIALSVVLDRGRTRPAPRPIPGAPLLAGFAGGFLGGLSSLNGVGPVLLLTRERVAPIAAIANLAFYFVVSNAIGLGVLAVTGALSTRALFPAVVVWLPGALVGNALGVATAPRLPVEHFRRLTLGIVCLAGAVIIATAVR